MAINFPSGVANGTISGNYTYDSSIPGWRKTPENAASLPAGTIVQWPGATAPANWLLCRGQAVSRTTYASLFAAIGVQYGTGDGSTTFNLPDLRGRVAVGLDSTQTEFDVLGETGGAKTHTLTSAEIPSHTHTVTDPGHSHNIPRFGGGSGGWGMVVNAGMTASQDQPYNYTAGSGTGISLGSTGGGGAHNNLQPYLVLNHIIKTSAGITSGDSELATRVGVVEAANNQTPLSANYIINGALDTWQRSTSATQGSNTSGYPSADRFKVWAAGAAAPTLTLARSTDVPSSIGITYSGALSWSASTSTSDVILGQIIENGKYLFAGKTMTFSFYAKAASNITVGLNFDQDYGSASFSLTTSWTRFTYTISLPSTYQSSRPASSRPDDHTELRFLRLNSTSSAANTIYFTGVQLEEGAYATPFRRNAPSIQAELAACQRYYYRLSTGTSRAYFSGMTGTSTFGLFTFPVPVAMRTAPTALDYGGTLAVSYSGFGGSNVSSLAISYTSPTSVTLGATSGTNGGIGAAALLVVDSSCYVGVSAEL